MTQKLESLVRAGNFAEARRLLRELNLRKIQRRDALTYANLARRLDLGSLSLKILNPIVRPPNGRRGASRLAATPEEKIEYAASLRNIGAVEEAIDILDAIDSRQHPQALFHLALCLIADWRYSGAIPLLRSYIESFKSPDYGMYVGMINLVEAYNHEERFDEARQLMAKLRSEVRRSEFPLLDRKMLELSAQLEIAAQNWDQAISRLREAEDALGPAQDSMTALFIKKWLAISRTMESGKIQDALSEARRQATEYRSWETVRDCDFYTAKVTGDQEMLIRLYFGTPFQSYRKRLLKDLRAQASLPEVFLWNGDLKANSKRILNLANGRSSIGKAHLSPGQSLHRLLIILCQDFYRPAPLPKLFSKLFPGEIFQLDTSPNRVRQIIKRFREWIDENSVPWEIDEDMGSYRLKFNASYSIAIPRSPLPTDQRELELVWLRSFLRQDRFTIREAVSATGSSKSPLNELLKWAVETGKLELEGHTHRAQYKWVGEPLS